MDYSESDDTFRLTTIMIKTYGHEDTRNIYKVCEDLMDRLTHEDRFSRHYNKYTIAMNVLHSMYPHHSDVVHSYSGMISSELHRIRAMEQEKRREQRTSCRCWD